MQGNRVIRFPFFIAPCIKPLARPEADMHEIIETDRTVLRPLAETDAVAFARLVNHWDICRMTGSFPYPFDAMSVAGRVDIFLARAAIGTALHWAITLDGEFIGAIGLYRIERGWDVGYWIGEPWWGCGIASEVVVELSRHVFRCRPGAVLTASVFTDNPASAHVLRKAGFRQADAVSDGYSIARREVVPNWTFTCTAADHAAHISAATLETID